MRCDLITSGGDDIPLSQALKKDHSDETLQDILDSDFGKDIAIPAVECYNGAKVSDVRIFRFVIINHRSRSVECF